MLLASGGGYVGSEGLPGAGEIALWDVAGGRAKASLKGRVKLRITPKTLSYLRADGVPRRVLLKLATLHGREFTTEQEAERELPKLLEKVLDQEQQKKYGKTV